MQSFHEQTVPALDFRLVRARSCWRLFKPSDQPLTISFYVPLNSCQFISSRLVILLVHKWRTEARTVRPQHRGGKGLLVGSLLLIEVRLWERARHHLPRALPTNARDRRVALSRGRSLTTVFPTSQTSRCELLPCHRPFDVCLTSTKSSLCPFNLLLRPTKILLLYQIRFTIQTCSITT